MTDTDKWLEEARRITDALEAVGLLAGSDISEPLADAFACIDAEARAERDREHGEDIGYGRTGGKYGSGIPTPSSIASWHLEQIAEAEARGRRAGLEEAVQAIVPRHKFCMHAKCEGRWEAHNILRALLPPTEEADE